MASAGRGIAANGLDYSWEAIREYGSDGPNDISDWGTTGGVGYRFDPLPLHDRFGIADLFGWQNIQSYRAGFATEPRAAGPQPRNTSICGSPAPQ